MIENLEIVYLQTSTACNGHCSYCPHDDIYGSTVEEMHINTFKKVVSWLENFDNFIRVGFLLHYEPTLDKRLLGWLSYLRCHVPKAHLEVATNGKQFSPILEMVDRVDLIPAGSLEKCTTRAGNARQVEGIDQSRVFENPCYLPDRTMCINYKGEVILCCQDWRAEVVCGTVDDLDKAREKQLELAKQDLEICRDCLNCRTAEQVGARLGRRYPCNR